MPTLMEIADLADVPAEGVLRVLNGDPVGENIAKRVRLAIATLGTPHQAVVQGTSGFAPSPRHDENVVSTPDELMETISRVTAELEARLPEGVGSVVYEAVRVEVEPVAQHMGQMGTLVKQLSRVVERIDSSVTSERQARLDDIKLLTELIVTGWQTVDRRLARLEQMLESAGSGAEQRVYRLSSPQGRGTPIRRTAEGEL
jgi:hypothetical protein